jgi:hypothetical protein
MGFSNWQVEADESFVPEADPAIAALKRKGGAAILQDIQLNTYWANTVGATAYHSPHYNLYLEELKENMLCMMRTRATYREIEEFMVVLGYETTSIRDCFRRLTGIDPVKMEYMRQSDVNNTPANIPWYNMGWGMSKKKGDGESYFVMPASDNLYTVFCQVDDMQRSEVGSFIRPEEALEYLKAFVKKVHRYDLPAQEQAADHLEPLREESTKKEYRVFADHLWDLGRKGLLDTEWALRTISDAVTSGTLTVAEGEDLLNIYVQAAPPEAQDPVAPHKTSPKETPVLDYRQDTADVNDELDRSTPQDFFKSVLPDRMDAITPEHIKDVLTYVTHRGKDMTEFDIHLHSLEYMKHEIPQVLVETNPDTGRPAGPPKATVSVILEVMDRTLPNDHNRKYALAVFFVNPDGDVSTSDSVKGEDDIIYGFSEDGLRQYFSRDRMMRGGA